MSVYLDAVVPGVEEANASNIGQDGVRQVVQHVVGGHRRKAVSLANKTKRDRESDRSGSGSMTDPGTMKK